MLKFFFIFIKYGHGKDKVQLPMTSLCTQESLLQCKSICVLFEFICVIDWDGEEARRQPDRLLACTVPKTDGHEATGHD